VLKAFRTYYSTAELSGVTDPNLVYDLRAKLDGTGFHDDFEVDRVVAVEMNAKSTQGDLAAALTPVADRLMKRYAAGRERQAASIERSDTRGAQEAQDEIDPLLLFKSDMALLPARLHLPLADFSITGTQPSRSAIFFRRLLPLLDFGREREGVDLSKLKLTHHGLKSQGKRNIPLEATRKIPFSL
jgi:type I restriction enzyme R subunit